MNIEKKIKKMKGEKFLKTIRNYHNGIFEIPNILDIIKHASKDDAEVILPYLVSLLSKDAVSEENRTIKELLDEAGYDFTIVSDKKSQDEISKHFKSNEKLCTFGTNRYSNYYIVNVWKKNVSEIKRSDFVGKEKRDDEYGTSVMSIQISKKGGFISIKNRYNSTVKNCDNTLSSNPDNIIQGLSSALQKYFGVSFSSHSYTPDEHIIYDTNKLLKYNYEINGVFIGENAYLKNGKLYEINKDTQVVVDYYIIDYKHKTCLRIYDNASDDFASYITKSLIEGNLKIIKQ